MAGLTGAQRFDLALMCVAAEDAPPPDRVGPLADLVRYAALAGLLPADFDPRADRQLYYAHLAARMLRLRAEIDPGSVAGKCLAAGYPAGGGTAEG